MTVLQIEDGLGNLQAIEIIVPGAVGNVSSDVSTIQGIGGMYPITVTNTSNAPIYVAGSVTANFPTGQQVTVTNTSNTPLNVAGSVSASVQNTSNTPLYLQPLPSGTNLLGSIIVANTSNTPLNVTGSVSVTLNQTLGIQNTGNTSLYLQPLPAGSNTIGNVNVVNTANTPLNTVDVSVAYTPVPVPSLTAAPQQIKAMAGTVGHVSFVNTSTSAWAYLKFYDSATSVNLNTANYIAIYGLPPSSGQAFETKLSFTTGIYVVATANPAQNDATAPAGIITGTVGIK